jgi:hypothetical protein
VSHAYLDDRLAVILGAIEADYSRDSLCCKDIEVIAHRVRISMVRVLVRVVGWAPEREKFAFHNFMHVSVGRVIICRPGTNDTQRG